jgi:xylulose-5-phosphate/fructose-6-phosphate phosphoketolase
MQKREGVEAIKKYVRATNYLTVAQLYLQDNFFLRKELSTQDIKPRLLGHWGTSPGINFIYANLNFLIKKYNLNMLFVLGPGHGFPALQANLFLEGSLEKFYPKAKQNSEGISYIAKHFSWPYGFPSHSNPASPGVILEGGELGYALSTAYGAVLDNPDLIVACVIGDGEAETGPTATAWHLNKFIDPSKNGTVLPILHLNGYKISGPTVFGRMSNKELKELFSGYGYTPFIVDATNSLELPFMENEPYEKMITTLDECYSLIKEIKIKSKEKDYTPRLPMIILRTEKGWTGIKELHGEKLEGNCLSHQIVAKNAKTDLEDLKAIEKWMKSYKFEELFTEQSGFSEEIKALIPKNKMGLNKHAFAGQIYEPLKLPKAKSFTNEFKQHGTVKSSSMKSAGEYLAKVFDLNKNIRLFSPDETYSNKLDAIFKSTKRSFVWPLEKWDKDFARHGKVIEMLSEHSLQGLAQGYILTGRHSILASYEAFIEVVSSMADQYEKFLKVAREISWRKDIPSFNYILTSSGWRQEHNGFSHQNPKFISGMLEKNGSFVKVYFPADANSTILVLEKCLQSKNMVNVLVAGKTDEPNWLTQSEAEKELKNGLMTWEFASDNNPQIVLVGIGDYMTKECLAAITEIKKIMPKVKIRFVNIMEVSALGLADQTELEKYFTKDLSVIINYHGYPGDIKEFLFRQKNSQRFSVHGYTERGSTTTPFDMHVRNGTSRYHLVMEAAELLAEKDVINKNLKNEIVERYKDKLGAHRLFITENGVDPPEIEDWKWTRNF